MFSSQELDASLLGDLEEGQSKAAALPFSLLCKQRCSSAFVYVRSLELSTLSVSVPQQAEKRLPFPPVPSRGRHGNYWMSEPSKVTKEVRIFEYFVSSGTTKFGTTLSIHLFSMKCIES